MRQPDPFLPSAAKVAEAHARWQRLVGSAEAGNCSPCFAHDALKAYIRLHNQRADAQLAANPPKHHPPMSLEIRPTVHNYGEARHDAPRS